MATRINSPEQAQTHQQEPLSVMQLGLIFTIQLPVVLVTCSRTSGGRERDSSGSISAARNVRSSLCGPSISRVLKKQTSLPYRDSFLRPVSTIRDTATGTLQTYKGVMSSTPESCWLPPLDRKPDPIRRQPQKHQTQTARLLPYQHPFTSVSTSSF